ncbi:protein phosphatase inhibitor 2-like [Adelges cooleyi]|uniref:protein phosphatase inhibitor 2-like n=1 Tax=Adelges cooleyi TaxID=133065 RepID=UPI00217FD0C6|nr:protein phosphatase inhibitor 2-like [Adelges cooleyi]
MASSSGSEDPTDNLKKEPSKGILKPSVSYEEKDKKKKIASKSAKWDEMNILETLHPPDKDYGHMKVDEPKTPYEREINEDDDMDGGVNPDELRKRIEESKQRKNSGSSTFQSEDDSEDNKDETPEEKLAREVFEKKRKEHYNEFKAAKMARQMMDEEDNDEDDENK